MGDSVEQGWPIVVGRPGGIESCAEAKVEVMEQIEQALRKAREQRVAVASQREPARIPNYGAPVAVAYLQTKIVTAQADTLERNRVVAAQLTHPVTDVYRTLRAQVLQRLTKLERSTLGITSAGADEGKTLTAVNLAVAISTDSNQTVLLVDVDLRDPGVAQCLGFQPSKGLTDYLAGQATVAECLINPGLERLTVLPSTSPVGNSAELLSSPQMAQLARELKNRYPDRLIIYDLPPLLVSGDALGFLPNVEATLLVVREGKAKISEVERAARLLSERCLIGTVLNAAE